MENTRMTRHIENSFNDIGLEELRRSVYDYTSYYYQTTYPDRDAEVFCRENMLSPFDNIADKVNAIINTLKMYWNGLDKGYNEILDIVKKESLLGQAIYLIARKNVNNDDIEMTFDVNLQDIPVVFGDLMILYTQSGYDVRNLKDFLVELYDEYYPKVDSQEKAQIKEEQQLQITDGEYSFNICDEYFRLINLINTNFMNDYIIGRILHRSPDQNDLKDIVNHCKSIWINGFKPNPEDFIEYHDQHSNSVIRYLPILNAVFIIKTPCKKNKEYQDILHQQIEAMVLKAFKDMELDLHGGDFHNDTINNEAWRRIIANKTDNLLTEVMINHSENIPIGEETINGSLVMIRLSIIDH